MAFLGQAAADEGRHPRLVFDEENPHSAGIFAVPDESQMRETLSALTAV
jgi:hypothetical protein